MAEKPLVTIAMAIYKPNEEWFIKQLQSVDDQDYRPLKLLIWNDSPFDFQAKKIVTNHVKNIPFEILDNDQNNGVTKAFEELTRHAEGKYIAYSDQDDIWAANKISVMVDFMEAHPHCTCCHSDAALIDEENKVIRKSIYPESLEILNTRQYQEKVFLVKNWNVGCAMMMTIKAAKASVPFPTMVYHDQWLEMYAMALGDFCYIPECLIEHRVHGANNSQTLHGIESKQDYYRVKLQREIDFFDFLVKHLPCKDNYKHENAWIKAREKYSRQHSVANFLELLKYLNTRSALTLFELLLPFIPDAVFSVIIKMIRKEVRVLGYR